jgi:DNA polymerase-4
VGPKAEERLAKLGVVTIGDLAGLPPGRLEQRLGTHGLDMQQLARGIDERPVHAEHAEAKSLGQEHTYGADTADRERLRRTLLDLADGVARRLRSHGLRARTVTLKYRDEDFRTLTRAETLPNGTDSGDALFRAAWRLFEGVHGSRKVRLLGLYASGFDEEQRVLFPEQTRPADRVRDIVTERFGDSALTRASLIGRRVRRHPESKG